MVLEGPARTGEAQSTAVIGPDAAVEANERFRHFRDAVQAAAAASERGMGGRFPPGRPRQDVTA
jgi:hypothetical protein